jgi:hypothetical protein
VELKIHKVYLFSVEEETDYIFTPSGIVLVLNNNNFKLYSTSSHHNRFRSVLNKFSWSELEHGVSFRNAEYRIDDVTDEFENQGWTSVDSIPDILRHLYTANRLQLFFLQRYVDP